MQSKIRRIEDVFARLERIFSLGGIWPGKPTYIKYTVYIVYFTLHLCMTYADLAHVFGNLELMVVNIVDTIVHTITYTIVWAVRCNGLLKRLIEVARQDIAESDFECAEEEEIYYKYNYMSTMFCKISITAMLVNISFFFFKPLILFAISGAGRLNSTEAFVLPCRVRTFFNVSSVRTYALCYIYLSPIIYVAVCHMTAICVLVCLVFHICGKLRVLSFRIRNINVLPNKPSRINAIVETHLKIVWMAKSLTQAFNIILLDELFGNTLVLAISVYYVIMNLDASEMATCFSFVFFAIVALVVLYGYCLIGDQLIQQSMNVKESYYYCNWQEMPNAGRKEMLICMVYAQNTSQLSAGGIYTFSLSGFTGILKSSMAYVSILRTLL